MLSSLWANNTFCSAFQCSKSMLTRFEAWSTMFQLVSRHHWFVRHPINIWRHTLLDWWILWNVLVRSPQRWLNKCDSSQEQPVLYEDVVRTVGVGFFIPYNVKYKWESISLSQKEHMGVKYILRIILINKHYAAWSTSIWNVVLLLCGKFKLGWFRLGPSVKCHV